MAKSSGLGDNFFFGGVDVSGDTQSLGQIGGGPSPWEVTGIDKSAFERIGLLRSGRIQFVTFFNDVAAGSFQTLKTLPRTDVQLSYFRGTTLGNAAASMTAKQVNHDCTREASGGLTFACEALSSAEAHSAPGHGLVWGQMLTAGKKTDTSGANGTSIDQTASTSFGWEAYLHVFSVAGTSVTVTLEDSADNSSFATFTSSAFTAVNAGSTSAQRIAGTTTSTVRRYVRAVTSGTFSSAVFAVNFVRHTVAQT